MKLIHTNLMNLIKIVILKVEGYAEKHQIALSEALRKAEREAERKALSEATRNPEEGVKKVIRSETLAEKIQSNTIQYNIIHKIYYIYYVVFPFYHRCGIH